MATAQYLTELALALRQRGHQVTVVTSRHAYDHPGQQFPGRESWNGIDIRRVRSTRFGKGARWRRAADFASFLLSCCLRLLFLQRQDVVVALTTPPLISFVGACLARLRGGRFVYWVMDLNPDEAVAAGWLDPASPAGRGLERISRFSLRNAARIVALDRFMKDRIVAKGIDPQRVVVIPPWSQDDAVAYDAAGRTAWRQAHGLAGKFVVMYSGNHSPIHPLDTLMAAAEALREDDAVHFCFVGGGSEFKRVQAFAADRRLPNILCLPYQPFAQLSASLSAADLQVVVMGEAFVGLVHPCKIYNMLRVGAPVLYVGPEPSHVTEIFAQLPAACLRLDFRHGHGPRLAAAIRRLLPGDGAGRRGGDLPAHLARDRQLPRLVEVIERA